jgi:putative ABC transport system permease protein
LTFPYWSELAQKGEIAADLHSHSPGSLSLGKPEGASGVITRMSKYLTEVSHGLRQGFRLLYKTPTFTATAVIILALGIGANSAIFSIVNAVLLRPLPYQHPERLAVLWGIDKNNEKINVSPADYLDWKQRTQSFEQLGAVATQPFNMTGRGMPERVGGTFVTASMFQICGVPALYGRMLLPEDDNPGGRRVIVISYSLWQRRFGSDPGIVGTKVDLDGNAFTVVGVMPQNFRLVRRAPQDVVTMDDADVWVPLAFDPGIMRVRGAHFLLVVGQLKPGATVAQAQAEMAVITRQLEQQYPQTNSGITARIVPLYDQLAGKAKAPIYVLLGVVAFVLLIACLNLANLLLAKGTARRKEFAIRSAVGASSGHLIRQLLVESLLLCMIGGIAGLLLAWWGAKLLIALGPSNIPRWDSQGVDVPVLIFTFVISMLAGIVFGLFPAFQASRLNVNDVLKEGGSSLTGGHKHWRLQSLLVILEITIAIVLLVGAGLMIRSIFRLYDVKIGFNPSNLLTTEVALPALPGSKYADRAQSASFFEQLIQRLESFPEIKSVAITNNLPLSGRDTSIGYVIQGRPPARPGELNLVGFRVVSYKYMQTMGIPLLKGRDFNQQDTANSPQVAIINDAMARANWGQEDPLGKRIQIGGPAPREIVGIIENISHFGVGDESKPEVFVPYSQVAMNAMFLVVRTSSAPKNIIGAVQREVLTGDPNQPVSKIKTMQELYSESIAERRFTMTLLTIFAAVALIMAAVGMYSLVSYAIKQRAYELGIRMALGATPSEIIKMVLRQGASLAAIGSVVGIVAALLLTRIMSSMIYGVGVTDPITFISITAISFVTAIIASYIPARQATRIDPMTVFRSEGVSR